MSFFNNQQPPVTLTALAAEEIRKVIADKQLSDEYGLRVGIKGGGCSASYLLGFDKPKEADDTFLIDGIRVYVDKRHTMYILGLEIDFEEGANGKGFTFNNPATQSS